VSGSCLLVHPWLWIGGLLGAAFVGAVLGYVRGRTRLLLLTTGVRSTVMRAPDSGST
jgi:hypothetical protein